VVGRWSANGGDAFTRRRPRDPTWYRTLGAPKVDRHGEQGPTRGEGDGWVNLSGLATSLAGVSRELQ